MRDKPRPGRPAGAIIQWWQILRFLSTRVQSDTAGGS